MNSIYFVHTAGASVRCLMPRMQRAISMSPSQSGHELLELRSCSCSCDPSASGRLAASREEVAVPLETLGKALRRNSSSIRQSLKLLALLRKLEGECSAAHQTPTVVTWIATLPLRQNTRKLVRHGTSYALAGGKAVQHSTVEYLATAHRPAGHGIGMSLHTASSRLRVRC